MIGIDYTWWNSEGNLYTKGLRNIEESFII